MLPTNSTPPIRSISRLSLLSIAALIGLLYFAKDFIVPIVLAALLSFLLDPINRRLERWRLPHVFAVLTTTLVAFFVIGALVYLVATQVIDLAQKLPDYRNNLIQKAESLKMSKEGPFARALETLKDVAKTIEKDPPPTNSSVTTGDQPAPVPVQVVPSASQTFSTAGSVLGPVISPLGAAAVVILLAVFMMMGRDDLRDRVIHLVGRGRLRLTTHALDEAGRKVSRYLFAQLLVNVSYGIPIGLGLYLIGIPNAFLWGLLTIVLRFLPYIGPWIAAAFPVLLSVAVSTSWSTFLMTLGLFVVVELISNNVIEPWLYGSRTGLSPLAVVVSAVFWTWLWGIAGLVLATPVTVCLVVMGKHVPHLRWLDLLLGDRPPISDADRVYRRLLAGDEDDALEIVAREAKQLGSSAAAFDRVALPAVRLIESDFCDGLLLEVKRDEALLHLREIVAELGDARALEPGTKPAVLCIPANHLADEIVAEMLMEALHAHEVTVECLSSRLMTGETVAKAVEIAPAVICVSVISRTSLVAATFICKHLKRQLPKTRIVVGLWQEENPDNARRIARIQNAGAHRVLSSLEQMVDSVLEQISMLEAERPSKQVDPKAEAPTPAAA